MKKMAAIYMKCRVKKMTMMMRVY